MTVQRRTHRLGVRGGRPLQTVTVNARRARLRLMRTGFGADHRWRYTATLTVGPRLKMEVQW